MSEETQEMINKSPISFKLIELCRSEKSAECTVKIMLAKI